MNATKLKYRYSKKQQDTEPVRLTVSDICRSIHVERSSNGPNTDGACVRRTAWKRKNESIDVSVYM